MSTLSVVEEVLRSTATPLSVREIVDHAGLRLPSKSKTPDTVVARDLAMDIKRQGETSRFVRTSPGRYTLRELIAASPAARETFAAPAPSVTSSLASGGLKQERAATLPAKTTRAAEPARAAALRGPSSSAS